MTITCNKIGVWILDDVYKKTLSDYYLYCGTTNDIGPLFTFGGSVCSSGGLGDNSVTPRSSPVQVPGTLWTCVVGGGRSDIGSHMHALKSDSTLWGWGSNSCGTLGDGTLIHRSSPVQVPGTSWTKLNSGALFTNAIKSDNTLWGWGTSASGELGDSTLTCRSSPVQVPGTTWCEVTGRLNTVHALKTDGTLWGWGSPNGMGINSLSSIGRCSPTQVPGNTWSYVTSAIGCFRTYALKTDGTLWAWGLSEGSLGDNTVLHRSSPVQIPGTSWNFVSAGCGHTIATKTDNTVWTWGRDITALGIDLAVGSRSSPVQLPGTNWFNLYGGTGSSIATKTDGTLWTWGSNTCGQLGTDQSTAVIASSPVQVPGNRWSEVDGGMFFQIARKF